MIGNDGLSGVETGSPIVVKGVAKSACRTTPLGPFLLQFTCDRNPDQRTSRWPSRPGADRPDRSTGALIGYARVSTSGQLFDRQKHALAEVGCIRIFADKLSGKHSDRPELAACLDYLRAGDTLVVPSLDRLSRSLADLIEIVGTLRRQDIGFKSLHEALDTTTPGGRLVFHVFAALAEFIRVLIVEGTREGLDAARAREKINSAATSYDRRTDPACPGSADQADNSVSSIARLLGRPAAPRIYKTCPAASGDRPATALPYRVPLDTVPISAEIQRHPATRSVLRRSGAPFSTNILYERRHLGEPDGSPPVIGAAGAGHDVLLRPGPATEPAASGTNQARPPARRLAAAKRFY